VLAVVFCRVFHFTPSLIHTLSPPQASQYPVILSIENHCSVEQQKVMALEHLCGVFRVDLGHMRSLRLFFRSDDFDLKIYIYILNVSYLFVLSEMYITKYNSL